MRPLIGFDILTILGYLKFHSSNTVMGSTAGGSYQEQKVTVQRKSEGTTDQRSSSLCEVTENHLHFQSTIWVTCVVIKNRSERVHIVRRSRVLSEDPLDILRFVRPTDWL